MKHIKLFENFNNIGRIVLTGVSGSGKTTLLDSLSKEFKTVPEAARDLIIELKENDPSKLPWNNRSEFQKLVEKKQVDNFLSNNNCFFDRGIVDEIAYNLAYGRGVSSNLKNQCKNHKYDKVFLFQPYSKIYKQDDERVESFEESSRLFPFFVEAYKSFGYDPILMTNDTVQNRVKFVLDNLYNINYRDL